MDEGGHSTYAVRTRAVQAVLRGRSMADIADAYGADRSTVFRWVKRYEQEGEEGLLRRPVAGRPRKLGQMDEYELREIVLTPASHFG